MGATIQAVIAAIIMLPIVAGRPKSPGAYTAHTGINRFSFRDFRRIPALARVALGCEVRKVGRDMLIGLLFVRPQGGDQSWFLVRIAEEGG